RGPRRQSARGSAHDRERCLHELPERGAPRIRVARVLRPAPERGREGSVATHALEAVLADARVERLAGAAVAREIDAEPLVLAARADGLEAGEVAGALEPDVLEAAGRLRADDDERRLVVGRVGEEAVRAQVLSRGDDVDELGIAVALEVARAEEV